MKSERRRSPRLSLNVKEAASLHQAGLDVILESRRSLGQVYRYVGPGLAPYLRKAFSPDKTSTLSYPAENLDEPEEWGRWCH